MEINGKRAFQEKHEVNGKIVGGNIYCFYWKSNRNEVASKISPVPIYDKSLMVEIRSPGFKHQIHVAEVEIRYHNGQVRQRMSGDREMDSGRDIPWREKLRVYLDAWENETKAPDDGTALEDWQKLDVSMISMLREARIYSVEMLAAMPDNRLDAIPLGGRTLRDQAKAFLDAKNGNDQTDRLIARNIELEERMKLLETQFAEVRRADALKAQPADNVADVTSEPKRGPGRPPKSAAA